MSATLENEAIATGPRFGPSSTGQGIEDRGVVGSEGGRERRDHAIDLYARRAQRLEGAKDSAQGEPGPVLYGAGYGQGGEHDGQVRLDHVAGAGEQGPGGEVGLGHAERLLDAVLK